ncbi:serine/threonine protein kinase [Boudabousia liubingyangii]|uniref:Stk1 family PASTA domain-containing Ser/Thr kinase n=1 Tax=Boudabousia liubingyangii TaxID=1921764 RepID=UPI0009396301|nr:Stk1 family PASTA domain-containing Ser/Thr kinase [Boudabousia liubingyangii]OKL48532.1 serine/threonine protein kinase [Boudabousia liubingyangii]
MVDANSRRLAGRYELRGLIGRGGMAEVRLGYDTRLSRVVAIKMLRTDLARDPIFQERFRREAQSAASLNHPAIVAVYDTGEESLTVPDGSSVSVPYIVMEYVEGHTVRDLLQSEEPVQIDEAVEIVAGVLSALEYSHHEGLVHRDIKPGNIMLTNTGKIKVMDFGIARALTDSQATMTQTDAVVGTAQYLSPEQAQGEQVDARSDLYSTGCVLFELLTGRPPFRGDSAVAVAYQHVSEPPPVPSSLASDIPAALDHVVLRSLAKRRDDRYSSAAEMRADLMRAVSGGDVPPVPATAFISTQRVDPSTQTTTLPPLPPVNTTSTLPVQNSVQGTASTAQSFAPSTNTGGLPTIDTTDEKHGVGPWIYFLFGSLVVIALSIAAFVYFSKPADTPPPTVATEEVTKPVPDVVGKTQAQARSILKNAGFEMRLNPESVNSDDIPSDSVVSMEPKSGSELQPGAVVMVTLSKGPKLFALPNVAGQTAQDAANLLKSQGLKVSTKTQDDPTVEKGNVIGTEPAIGTELKAGDTVTLLVASGYVTIPTDLVGRPAAEAAQMLQELGLSVNQAEVETADAQAGTVVSVNPVGSVPIRSGVTLTVAKAPPVLDPTPQPEEPQPETPEGGN